MSMRRRLGGWLLAIPLTVAGSQVAHTFAYGVVYPNARVRLRDLIATGHGYSGTRRSRTRSSARSRCSRS